jgi:hypothetical protein
MNGVIDEYSCGENVDQKLKLGIARETTRLLKELAQCWGIKKGPYANEAQFLVQLALRNIAIIAAWQCGQTDQYQSFDGNEELNVLNLQVAAHEELQRFLDRERPPLDCGGASVRFN